MRFKESITDEQLDDFVGIIDNEGMGYMMLYGGLGLLEPDLVLDDPEDVKKVNDALKVIREFAELFPEL